MQQFRCKMIGTPANLDVLVLSADLSKGAMRLCLALLQRYNWKEKSGDTIPLTMSYLSHRCSMTAHAISKARRELETAEVLSSRKTDQGSYIFRWNYSRILELVQGIKPGEKRPYWSFRGEKKDQYGHKKRPIWSQNGPKKDQYGLSTTPQTQTGRGNPDSVMNSINEYINEEKKNVETQSQEESLNSPLGGGEIGSQERSYEEIKKEVAKRTQGSPNHGGNIASLEALRKSRSVEIHPQQLRGGSDTESDQ